MLAINRIALLVIGLSWVVIAAAGAVRGRPASPLLLISLIAAVAIAYSILQRQPLWLQRLLGIGANAVLLLGSLHALLLDWRADGPTLIAPLAAAAVLFLFGVPLVQLSRGTAPPAVWKGRA